MPARSGQGQSHVRSASLKPGYRTPGAQVAAHVQLARSHLDTPRRARALEPNDGARVPAGFRRWRPRAGRRAADQSRSDACRSWPWRGTRAPRREDVSGSGSNSAAHGGAALPVIKSASNDRSRHRLSSPIHRTRSPPRSAATTRQPPTNGSRSVAVLSRAAHQYAIDSTSNSRPAQSVSRSRRLDGGPAAPWAGRFPGHQQQSPTSQARRGTHRAGVVLGRDEHAE